LYISIGRVEIKCCVCEVCVTELEQLVILNISVFWYGNMKERDIFTDPGVDGEIILYRDMSVWNEVCNESYGT